MTGFVTLAEIERSLLNEPPRRRFIISNVLPAGPVLLYGASGSGKTGIAIRTAVAVAAGLTWADRSTTAGSVLYVAGEDVEGAKERMVGAALALGLSPSELPLAMMEAPPEGMTHNAARIAVIGAARSLAKQATTPIALIVVDTLAACFGPKSQDDATAASEYMNNADRTARELGCPFLSIHHTGKDENAGMRGSRVFFDRADAVLRVKRGKDATSFLTVEKMRNGPADGRFAFDIEGTTMPVAGGSISVQSIRSLRALPADTETPQEGKARQKQTDKDRMLGVLIRLASAGATDVTTWQEACYELWSDKSPDTRRKVFSKYRHALAVDGLICINGEAVTVTVTRNAEVTDRVTPQPDTVTRHPPLSIDRAGSDTTTGQKPPFLPGNDDAVAEGRSLGKGVVERPTGLSRGAGVEDPAETSRGDDGDKRRTGTEG